MHSFVCNKTNSILFHTSDTRNLAGKIAKKIHEGIIIVMSIGSRRPQ